MSSFVDWSNPYAYRDGEWLKGNLHAHTHPASACGAISIADCVDRYVERGYDFLSLSDHLTYTRHKDDRLTLIPGIEWNADKGNCHTGVYSVSIDDLNTAMGFTEHNPLLESLSTTDALTVLNHPNWQLRPHYRREELEQRHGWDGMEIFNAVIDRLDGYSIATDKWDYMLAKGRRVLGFASDDSHCESDIGRGAIYVRSRSRAATDILAAIKTGNFYCSSGASISDIRLEDGIVEIESPDAQEIWASVDGGRCVLRVADRRIRLDTREVDSTYVRFTIYGAGSAMAWTQPFFVP